MTDLRIESIYTGLSQGNSSRRNALNSEQLKNASEAFEFAPSVPRGVTLVVIVLCALPFIAGVLGFDLGVPHTAMDVREWGHLDAHDSTFGVYIALTGPLWHLILEWLAIATALLSSALAFSLFVMSRNIVAPVIGLTLLCAAGLDAFHALAAVRIVDTVASYDQLMPFSWALARILSALLLFLAVSVLVFSKVQNHRQAPAKLLSILSLLFLSLAYLVVQWSVSSEKIPVAIFPQDFVKRPYDVIPLVIYIVMGAFLLPKFRERHGGVFTDALVLSLFPAIVVELHMVFGSTQLFDHHFVAAHLLKILVYGVPFVGLVLDYHHTSNLSNLKTAQLHQTYRELQARTHELLKSNRSLEESNRFKSEFLGRVTYELRTPLNSVIGFSRILLKSRNSNEDTKSYKAIEAIFRNSTHLMGLINEILDLSKIETGRMSIDKSEFVISSPVEQVYNTLAPLAEHKKISLQLLNYARNVKIVSDQTKLQQILLNLGSNAVKYTEQGSVTIKVECCAHGELGDCICVSFADTGIGIPEKEKNKLFVEFGRTDEARNIEAEGTGLGLMISAKLAEVLGGTIDFDSEYGVGSEFRVSFPISGVDAPPVSQTADTTDSKFMDGIVVVSADIDPDATRYVEIALAEADIQVHSVHSRQQLIDTAEEFMPDLILLDLQLEGEGGGEALSHLVSHSVLKDIPKLAMSVDSNAQKAAAQQGADGFLEKPCEIDKLLMQVRKLVHRDISSVLLVGVYHEHRKILMEAFDELLVHTFFVADHAAALEKLSQFLPDMIIVNIGNESVETARLMVVLNNDEHHSRLPVMLYNGLEVIQKLKLESDVVREIREVAPSCETFINCFLGIRRNIRQRFMRIENINRRLSAEYTKPANVSARKFVNADDDNVLIVDATPDTAALIDWILQDIQVNHEVVNGGREALKRVLENSYSVLFIAIDLPDLHGREVLRRLRATNSYRNTPIVAIISDEHPVDVDELRELGFNEIIKKPVDGDRLLKVLRKFVSLRDHGSR
ncbi:signal transduction histidine kinase [Alteromonadaceae bacterium 2753L.S.0a.02]|nr:signal transduction histidine kinase [Alteromonadaceae bacterium 2753L.S.0a.02]